MTEESRPLVAVSLECLIDTRPAVLWTIHALSGASAADVGELEALGYEDPWLLARVAHCWVRARRPRPLPHANWRVAVNECGGDPGDLDARGRRLYAQLGWRHEAALVPSDRIEALGARVRLVGVTDRDRSGLARAQETLKVAFPLAVTGEDAARPDASVLSRFGPGGHFLGRGLRDRACAEGARFAFHELGDKPSSVIERLISRLSPSSGS